VNGKQVLLKASRNSRISILAALGLFPFAAAAQQAPDTVAAALTPFAVNIDRAEKQPWPGYGIYLGDGLVITAAHVAGPAYKGEPSVHIAGQVLKAKFVKVGDFEGVDLTVLRIDPRGLPASLGLRRMPICDAPPTPGQPVVTVTPQAVATSHIFPPRFLPPGAGRFGTAIADVATTGNSGSGVFDPARECLMGVMSRKIQTVVTADGSPDHARKLVDLAKYFVPAAEIRAFIKGL
jgi:hypothetical protein